MLLVSHVDCDRTCRRLTDQNSFMVAELRYVQGSRVPPCDTVALGDRTRIPFRSSALQGLWFLLGGFQFRGSGVQLISDW